MICWPLEDRRTPQQGDKPKALTHYHLIKSTAIATNCLVSHPEDAEKLLFNLVFLDI